jgi:hypothetical protein
MGGSRAHYSGGLLRFFADEAKKWQGKAGVDPQLLDVAGSWTVEGTAPGTPQQRNGSMSLTSLSFSCMSLSFTSMSSPPLCLGLLDDCGVFTCYFANFVAVDAPLSFSQADLPLFRCRMTVDTLRKLVE